MQTSNTHAAKTLRVIFDTYGGITVECAGYSRRHECEERHVAHDVLDILYHKANPARDWSGDDPVPRLSLALDASELHGFVIAPTRTAYEEKCRLFSESAECFLDQLQFISQEMVNYRIAVSNTTQE